MPRGTADSTPGSGPGRSAAPTRPPAGRRFGWSRTRSSCAAPPVVSLAAVARRLRHFQRCDRRADRRCRGPRGGQHAPGSRRAGHRRHVAVQLRFRQGSAGAADDRSTGRRIRPPCHARPGPARGHRGLGKPNAGHRGAAPVAGRADATPGPARPQRAALPGLLPRAAGRLEARYRAAGGGRYPNLAAALAAADPPRSHDDIFASCIDRFIDLAGLERPRDRN
jgi:hypothetical protein